MSKSNELEVVLLKNEIEELKSKIDYLETLLQKKNVRNAGRKNITLDIQKEIIEEYHKGIHVSTLSGIYDLCPATIYSILKRESAIQKQEERETEVQFITEKSESKSDNIMDYFNQDFFS